MSGKHLNDISKVYLDTVANVKKAETNADIKRWEDLGGPTPGNYRADDNSAKLKEGRRLRKSDWRQDLKEVIDKPETEEKAEKKVDEKKGIKNKIVINPTFKEAIEEIGGELLEVNEVDSVQKTQEDTQKKQEQQKKQLEQKQKKIAAMKKLVLRKKMQAVGAGGGEDITAGYEPEGEVVVEKDLSAAERRALPNKDFVFPGKGEGPEGKQRGAYPINDKKHARAALAMAAAHASPEKEAKVKAAVKKKYPEIEVQSEGLGTAVATGVKAAGKWAVRQGIKVGGKAGGKFVKKAGKEAVKAAGEVAVETGKGAVDAAKKRGRKAGEDFATNVGKKKEVDEGVLQMVKSIGKKKKEKKAKMDDITTRVHQWRKDREKEERRKYVSDFDPIDESAVLDAYKELSDPPKPKRSLGKKVRRAVLLNLIKRGKTKKEIKQVMHGEEVELDERLGGKGYQPYTDLRGKKISGDWEDSDRGKGNKAKKRAGGKVEKKSPTYLAHVHNKEEVVDEGIRKKIKVGMRLAKREAGRLVVDDPGGAETYGSLGNPKPGDKAKRDKERAAKKRVKEEFVDEAKVDTGTPEEKEKARNIRKFGVSHNVAGHGKLRRALHRSDRGYKKKKGDKSQYVEMEGTDKAFNFVVNKLKAQHGDGVLTKGDKIKPPTAAQKKKNAEIMAQRAKQDGRDATEKASDGRYNDRSRSD